MGLSIQLYHTNLLNLCLHLYWWEQLGVHTNNNVKHTINYICPNPWDD